MTGRRGLAAALLLLSALSLPAAIADGSWLGKVPERDRGRLNPYSANEQAVAAGSILYGRSCASCHGANAHGTGTRPSLATARVHVASDGELFWLLTNGNLAHGMPSWSKLPEAQRWQLVRYLHALPLDGSQAR